MNPALFVSAYLIDGDCRVHSAHKQTPAQAAMLTKEAWTVERLIEECGNIEKS
jgi:hypothetical protein